MDSFSAHICCAQFAMATKGGQNSKKGDKNQNEILKLIISGRLAWKPEGKGFTRSCCSFRTECFLRFLSVPFRKKFLYQTSILPAFFSSIQFCKVISQECDQMSKRQHVWPQFRTPFLYNKQINKEKPAHTSLMSSLERKKNIKREKPCNTFFKGSLSLNCKG